MAEEAIAPLDAYATAKPDEPTFTLQGGDPLAAPLVRLWATAARFRAGIGTPATMLDPSKLLIAAQQHSVVHNERECENLKVRATAAEEVSWAMDAYANGEQCVDVPSEAADTHLSELQRIDLHDLRVRAVGRINSMVAELNELRPALVKAGFEDYLGDLLNAENHLVEASRVIEPRRIFKKD